MWVGSKGRYVKELTRYVPAAYNRYYEPFLGSGSLYLHLNPNQATLSDNNHLLINTWEAIRHYPQETYSILRSIKTDSDTYYDIRTKVNQLLNKELFETLPTIAAYFIYICQVGFRGLWRVNSDGLLNTSYGHRPTIIYPKHLLQVSQQLSGTLLLQLDFKHIPTIAKPGDFVYLDPPYDNTWGSYLDSTDIQDDIAQVYKQLSDNNIMVMLSNYNTDRVRDLYRDYEINTMNVVHNTGKDCRHVSEVIVTNYNHKAVYQKKFWQ